MTGISHERRVIMRVYNAWKNIAGSGFPKRSQIDPAAFGADWSNCLIVELDSAASRSHFSYLGSALCDEGALPFEKKNVSECRQGSVLELVARHVSRALLSKEPVGFGGPASHNGRDILYRTILLPLSETGERIDGLLAAISYCTVSIAEEIPSDIAWCNRMTPETPSPPAT
jgi:hypothetical protein